jgi:hypothetical protein
MHLQIRIPLCGWTLTWSGDQVKASARQVLRATKTGQPPPRHHLSRQFWKVLENFPLTFTLQGTGNQPRARGQQHFTPKCFTSLVAPELRLTQDSTRQAPKNQEQLRGQPVLSGYKLQSRTGGPGLDLQVRPNKCPTETSISV